MTTSPALSLEKFNLDIICAFPKGNVTVPHRFVDFMIVLKDLTFLCFYFPYEVCDQLTSAFACVDSIYFFVGLICYFFASVILSSFLPPHIWNSHLNPILFTNLILYSQTFKKPWNLIPGNDTSWPETRKSWNYELPLLMLNHQIPYSLRGSIIYNFKIELILLSLKPGESKENI